MLQTGARELITIAVLAAALFAPSVPGSMTVRAQEGASLSVMIEGSRATLVVHGVQERDQFNGFDITMTFDPSLAEATEVTAAGPWMTDLVPPAIDNNAGTLIVVAISLDPSCVPGCELFSVAFAARGAGGPTTLRVQSTDLATARGLPVPLAESAPAEAVIQVAGATPPVDAAAQPTIAEGEDDDGAPWPAITLGGAAVLAVVVAAGVVVLRRRRQSVSSGGGS